VVNTPFDHLARFLEHNRVLRKWLCSQSEMVKRKNVTISLEKVTNWILGALTVHAPETPMGLSAN